MQVLVLVPLGQLGCTGAGQVVRAALAGREMEAPAEGQAGLGDDEVGSRRLDPAPAGQEPALLLKVGEVARLLGVGQSHAYELVARGEIPSLRIGRSLRVRRDALLAWLDARGGLPGGGER